MIRAYSNCLARHLILAGYLATVAVFGTIGMVSTSSARSYITPLNSAITVFKKKSHEPFIKLAQRDRNKQRGRGKNRRGKKFRGFNNRQSNRAVSSGKAAPLGSVARRVRRRVPGQLLDARLMKDRRGNLVYRLKILGRNGVMRRVTADAYSGAILGVR